MTDLLSYEEATGTFDTVIGLEVHVELGTATKMFDAAPNEFGGAPNTLVTPTSLGLPGSLPVVNATGVGTTGASELATAVTAMRAGIAQVRRSRTSR